MKKNVRMGLAVLLPAVLLSGCGTAWPELSDAQYDYVVEFAAGALMQHSYNQTDRLTYVEPDPEPEETGETKEDSGAAKAQDVAAAQEPSADWQDQQGVEETAEDADTAAAGKSGSSARETAKTAGEKAVVSLADSALVGMLNGLELVYAGYDVTDSYPDMLSQGAVVATPGRKLLVLKFQLQNNTADEIPANLENKGFGIRILMDGESKGFAMTTMLEDSLADYRGSLAAGESVQLVVLKELPEEELAAVGSLSLEAISGSGSQIIELEP